MSFLNDFLLVNLFIVSTLLIAHAHTHTYTYAGSTHAQTETETYRHRDSRVTAKAKFVELIIKRQSKS